MAEIELFHYRPGNLRLHRADTAMKYLSAIALSIGIFQSSLIELFCLTILLGVLSIPYRYPMSLKGLKGFFLLLLAIVISRAATLEGTPIPFIPFFSREGLLSGFHHSWRLILLLIMGQLLLSTTDPSDLQSAIYRLLNPLPLVPAGKIATMISLTILFIPLIFDQMLEAREAAEARLASQTRNPVKKILVTALPLMQMTLSRADEVAAAMESRCYRDDILRDPADKKGSDFLLFIISSSITVLIFLVNS